jgi:hypothetical protein
MPYLSTWPQGTVLAAVAGTFMFSQENKRFVTTHTMGFWHRKGFPRQKQHRMRSRRWLLESDD